MNDHRYWIQDGKGLVHIQTHLAELETQRRGDLTAHELAVLTVGLTGAQQHLACMTLGVSQATQVVDQVRGSKAALEAAIDREYIRMRELT